MAAIQYLIPGGACLNEDTSEIEFLIPGGAYIRLTLQEVSTLVHRQLMLGVGI